jgi:hypothetical protein
MKPDLTKPPYADGNPTGANPNYTAWKAKKDLARQTTVNGAPKSMPRIIQD